MKTKLYFIVFMLFISANAQNRKYFKQLREFSYGAFLARNAENVYSHSGLDIDPEDIPIAYVKISPNQNYTVLLAFNEGPSDDPTYVFYKKESFMFSPMFSLSGNEIYIPGNGFIYTKDFVNKKYKFHLNGTVTEVKQPFYYLGIKTTTLKRVQLYSDRACTKKLAVLAPNSQIDILAGYNCDYDCERYLIKTPFGLIGWWKFDPEAFRDFNFYAD